MRADRHRHGRFHSIRMAAVLPSNVCRHSPVSTSQRREVLSMEPVASMVPCGLKDRQTISVAWPLYVWYSCPVSALHSLQVLSKVRLG